MTFFKSVRDKIRFLHRSTVSPLTPSQEFDRLSPNLEFDQKHKVVICNDIADPWVGFGFSLWRRHAGNDESVSRDFEHLMNILPERTEVVFGNLHSPSSSELFQLEASHVLTESSSSIKEVLLERLNWAKSQSSAVNIASIILIRIPNFSREQAENLNKQAYVYLNRHMDVRPLELSKITSLIGTIVDFKTSNDANDMSWNFFKLSFFNSFEEARIAKRYKASDIVLNSIENGERLVGIKSGCLIQGTEQHYQKCALNRFKEGHSGRPLIRNDINLSDKLQFLESIPWLLGPKQGDVFQMIHGKRSFSTPNVVAPLLFPEAGWRGFRKDDIKTSTMVKTINREPAYIGNLNTFSGYNNNTVLFGVAGSGASFMAGEILFNHIAGGGNAWTLRSESATQLEECLDASCYSLSTSSSISLNPFSLFSTDQSFEDDGNLITSWLVDMSDASDIERYQIMFAVNEAWKSNKSNATVFDVLCNLRSGTNISNLVADKIQNELDLLGDSNPWFTGSFTVSSKEKLVCFTLLFGEMAKRVIANSLLLLYTLQRLNSKSRIHNLLLIDPVDIFVRKDSSLFLYSLRHSIKYFYSLIMTCRPPSYNLSKAEHAIAEYCANVFLLDKNLETNAWLQQYIGLVKIHSQLGFNRSSNNTTFGWVCSHLGCYDTFVLERDPVSIAMLSSSPRTVQAYKLSRSKGSSVINAIRECANRTTS
jgi:hypothetical protein